MQGDKQEDITSAHNILKFKDMGHYFEQSWATIPEKDEDKIKTLH